MELVAIADVFPAASRATTPSLLDAPQDRSPTVYAVDAVDPTLMPFTYMT
jgi:hypothetical protein